MKGWRFFFKADEKKCLWRKKKRQPDWILPSHPLLGRGMHHRCSYFGVSCWLLTATFTKKYNGPNKLSSSFCGIGLGAPDFCDLNFYQKNFVAFPVVVAVKLLTPRYCRGVCFLVFMHRKKKTAHFTEENVSHDFSKQCLCCGKIICFWLSGTAFDF